MLEVAKLKFVLTGLELDVCDAPRPSDPNDRPRFQVC